MTTLTHPTNNSEENDHGLQLSERQRTILHEFAQELDYKNPKRVRAQIILALSQGVAAPTIAREFGIHMSTVYRWKRQWCNMVAMMDSAEMDGDNLALYETVDTVLNYQSWRKKSSELTDKQFSEIVEIFQETPDDCGYDIEFWTMKMVANEAKRRGIVDYISPTHLSFLLRKIGFGPLQNREVSRRSPSRSKRMWIDLVCSVSWWL